MERLSYMYNQLYVPYLAFVEVLLLTVKHQLVASPQHLLYFLSFALMLFLSFQGEYLETLRSTWILVPPLRTILQYYLLISFLSLEIALLVECYQMMDFKIIQFQID